MTERFFLSEAELAARLQRPDGPADVVLDTDTFNEIDDQYALAYLIRSNDRLRLQAIYAAPFDNHHSKGPKDGMERSYKEIFNVLKLLGSEEYGKVTYRGSDRFLENEQTPVSSPAAEDLVKRALEHKGDDPLYVVAIAAITNIASAILMCPEIVRHIVVIWLGGHSLDWPDNREFNCRQDVAAARVVFNSGVPLVQLPCMGVVSSFAVSEPELRHWLSGKNAFCDYMVEATVAEAHMFSKIKTWTRSIWDVTAVAWLVDERFMKDRLIHRPIPEYDDHWGRDETRPLMKYVYYIDRDALFEDLFNKITR